MADTKPKAEAGNNRESSALARRPLSDSALGLVPWWAPSIPPWKPIKSPNSSLRIGAIVSDGLFDGLRFEGEVTLLTPSNWQRILKYAQLDMLIIESTWETATGHWYLAQNTPAESSKKLRELVAAFRAAGIPTVFWNTEDHAYHDHYHEFATHFDNVFCADPQETALLNAQDIKAENLPPCVQPAIYNPFRKHEEYYAMGLGVLFDGWGDLDRNPENYTDLLLEIFQDHQLNIIESRYLLTYNRLNAAAGALSESILGCATRESRILALKYAKATISFEKTLSTPTTQCWEALQATASYCPAIHFGVFPANDIRNGLVQSFEDDLGALVELIRMEEDDLYRQRIAHKAWRFTLQNHTFSHRIRQICEAIGIKHDWEEYPKASVITPTCRPDMVPHAIATYRKQTYQNLELVLVYNGDRPDDLPAETEAPDIQVVHVPGDRFAGAALNLAAEYTSGKYCLRMDDDDIYGNWYVYDQLAITHIIDTDIFGKPLPPPFYFEGEQQLWAARESKWQPFQLFTGAESKTKVQKIAGNSIGYLRKLAGWHFYTENALHSADTFLLANVEKETVIAVLDIFNTIACRRDNTSTHTWRLSSEDIKKSLTAYPSIMDFEV